jgi:hypothetical protein
MSSNRTDSAETAGHVMCGQHNEVTVPLRFIVGGRTSDIGWKCVFISFHSCETHPLRNTA